MVGIVCKQRRAASKFAGGSCSDFGLFPAGARGYIKHHRWGKTGRNPCRRNYHRASELIRRCRLHPGLTAQSGHAELEAKETMFFRIIQVWSRRDLEVMSRHCWGKLTPCITAQVSDCRQESRKLASSWVWSMPNCRVVTGASQGSPPHRAVTHHGKSEICLLQLISLLTASGNGQVTSPRMTGEKLSSVLIPCNPIYSLLLAQYQKAMAKAALHISVAQSIRVGIDSLS